eukprot:GHVP01021725.1.p1 GENE.GHVP01021725.1~~GHVP01021725.1.p1  ORF type:complete len:871 (+),score=165.35 GHVP01021725.1:7-2619(+)
MTVENTTSLLHQSNLEIKMVAVEKLLSMVDREWPSIASVKDVLEKIYSDDIPNKEALALLISKLYFHLSDYTKSVSFALLAGETFISDTGNSLYRKTVLSHLLDQITEGFTTPNTLTERLILNEISSSMDTPYEILGYCIDSENTSLFTEILKSHDLLYKSAKFCWDLLSEEEDKGNMLSILRDTIREKLRYKNIDEPKLNMILLQISLYKKDIAGIVKLFIYLVDQEQDFTALSLSFYVWKHCTTSMREKIFTSLVKDSADLGSKDTMAKIFSIITGGVSNVQELEFLKEKTQFSDEYLQKARQSVSAKSSYLATSIIISNAIACIGTTDDGFLRNAIDWVTQSTNWARFTAVASIGQIHIRNTSLAREILADYLPPDDITITTPSYTEAGSLFAYGLVHSKSQTSPSVKYLLNILEDATDPIIQHGCSLGIGSASIGSGDKSLVESLRLILYSNDPISGLGSSIAIGLILAGIDDEISYIEELSSEIITFASESKHDKIKHGIYTGLALMSIGKGNSADSLIETLLSSREPASRSGGVLTIAAAYAGKYNLKSISTLQNAIVSDLDDSVKRNAAISLGFVMCKKRHLLLDICKPLLSHYNPSVRYGALLALGIGFSQKNDESLYEVLFPLLDDGVDYVSQAAYISISMIFALSNGNENSTAIKARAAVKAGFKAKQRTNSTKFGAIIGKGILNCAGQNGAISLCHGNNTPNLFSIAGLLLFSQYWEWLPLLNFVCLSVETRCLIALDMDLKPVDFKWQINMPPINGTYYKDDLESEKKKKKKAAPLVLETTSRRTTSKLVDIENEITSEIKDVEEIKKDLETVYIKQNNERFTMEEEINIEADEITCGVFMFPETEPSPPMDIEMKEE